MVAQKEHLRAAPMVWNSADWTGAQLVVLKASSLALPKVATKASLLIGWMEPRWVVLTVGTSVLRLAVRMGPQRALQTAGHLATKSVVRTASKMAEPTAGMSVPALDQQ